MARYHIFFSNANRPTPQILFGALAEEGHIFTRPIGGNFVSHLWVVVNLLVVGGEIVIWSQIGVWRAGSILQAAARNDSTRNAGSQILGVEIGKERIHLLVGHTTFIVASHITRPRHNIEIVGIVAQKCHTGCNGAEWIRTQSGSRIGECTALTRTFGEEVVHIAGRACGHEAYGLHTMKAPR